MLRKTAILSLSRTERIGVTETETWISFTDIEEGWYGKVTSQTTDIKKVRPNRGMQRLFPSKEIKAISENVNVFFAVNRAPALMQFNC